MFGCAVDSCGLKPSYKSISSSLTHTPSSVMGPLSKCGFLLPTQEFPLTKAIREFFLSSFLFSPSLFSISGLPRGTALPSTPERPQDRTNDRNQLGVERSAAAGLVTSEGDTAGPVQSAEGAWKTRAPGGECWSHLVTVPGDSTGLDGHRSLRPSGHLSQQHGGGHGEPQV